MSSIDRMKRIEELMDEYQGIIDLADSQGRDCTPAESAELGRIAAKLDALRIGEVR
jgi:hypothetical protein